MLRKILSLSVVVAALAVSTATLADGVSDDGIVCIERVDMLNRLASEFEEHLDEVKIIKDQGLLEALKSKTKGTWTIILTKPSGISCVLGTGDGLRIEEENPGLTARRQM